MFSATCVVLQKWWVFRKHMNSSILKPLFLRLKTLTRSNLLLWQVKCMTREKQKMLIRRNHKKCVDFRYILYQLI
jgi:hypothetical protein